jgi:hypothetical protein
MTPGAADGVICSRMYDVCDEARALWRRLFEQVCTAAGLRARWLNHDGPIEDLWSREDVLCTFECGLPFVERSYDLEFVVALVPSPPPYSRQPVYRTDFLVRTDDDISTLEGAHGLRLGWSVEHSQSGFNAVRHFLLKDHRSGKIPYTQFVGPLNTPKSCLRALMAGTVDVVPMDSFYMDLLRRFRPEYSRQFRVVASTPYSPFPPLVTSRRRSVHRVGALRSAFIEFGDRPTNAKLLSDLLVHRFVSFDAAEYGAIGEQHREAQSAGIKSLDDFLAGGPRDAKNEDHSRNTDVGGRPGNSTT